MCPASGAQPNFDCPEGELKMMRVPIVTVGDNVVDCYPELGVLYPGGNAINVAVHAKRIGIQSAYVGALGNDRAGQAILEALHSEGVDTSHTRIIDGENAYCTISLVNGNRVFQSSNLGVSRIVPRQSDYQAMSECAIVHTGECSGLENDLEAISSQSEMLSYDFSERPWDYISGLAPSVDIATISLPEDQESKARQIAVQVLELGPQIVAITLGASGVVLASIDEVVFQQAPLVKPVDTLGAGDAFIARMLCGFVWKETLQEIAVAATQYATNECLTHGGFGHETPLDVANISS